MIPRLLTSAAVAAAFIFAPAPAPAQQPEAQMDRRPASPNWQALLTENPS